MGKSADHDVATLVPAQRPKRLQDSLAYPPRAMRADRAAAYLSMSRSAFLGLVDAGTLPKPTRIGGMVLWDRLALDVAFEELVAVEGDDGDRPNSFDKIVEAIKK
jgi:predicted DNA-binding transcriptional regulator AlpA